MKHILTICILFCVGFSLQAQQTPLYSLYMFNKYNFNPAYAGLDNSLSITGVYRKQWEGLDGSPTTQNINAHMPVYYLGGGLGINIENDELGAEQLTSAMVTYNYHLLIGEQSTLSIGISGGIMQRTLDGTLLRTPEGIYSEFISEHNDPILPLGRESVSVPNFHAGAYFKGPVLEAGISVYNITEQDGELSTLTLKLLRHYIANVSLNLELTSSIYFHPSVMVRSDVTQTQIDFSALFRYNDNIFGGASFRGYNANSIDAVAILAGFKLTSNLTLAYAYDLTLSDLNTISNGSHEIMLNYNLNKRIGAGRPPRIIYNPRSL